MLFRDRASLVGRRGPPFSFHVSGNAMKADFTPQQRMVLNIAQANIPDTLTPFADMGKEAGLSESEVIALLQGMKDSGAIRRFGASLRHQQTKWKHNAMVAWKASEEEAEACGPIAAANPHVSHSYYRPSSASDWPYTLYTMIHGRSEQECAQVVEQLLAAWPLREYAMLRTVAELKKISMTYFTE